MAVSASHATKSAKTVLRVQATPVVQALRLPIPPGWFVQWEQGTPVLYAAPDVEPLPPAGVVQVLVTGGRIEVQS